MQTVSGDEKAGGDNERLRPSVRIDRLKVIRDQRWRVAIYGDIESTEHAKTQVLIFIDKLVYPKPWKSVRILSEILMSNLAWTSAGHNAF